MSVLQSSQWGIWGAGEGTQMVPGLASSISPSPASQPTLQTYLEVGGQEKLEFGDRS